ncbi:MAG: acyltransferase, partial [Rhizonema sp. PD38]|nr:acyltransferase [Rhizonema sp. PD38]
CSQIESYVNFLHNTIMHPSVKILADAKVDNLAKSQDLISIGKDSVIKGQLLVFPHGGKIEIGESCYVGEGTRIWSANSIKIGNRVFISHNVNIHDTNSHSIDAVLRYKHFQAIMSVGHPSTNDFDIQSKAVCIEDDVWIGFNSTILKDVKIGRGSIVAACSVVTKDVPEFVIVAGNPAQVVKHINKQDSTLSEKIFT